MIAVKQNRQNVEEQLMSLGQCIMHAPQSIRIDGSKSFSHDTEVLTIKSVFYAVTGDTLEGHEGRSCQRVMNSESGSSASGLNPFYTSLV